MNGLCVYGIRVSIRSTSAVQLLRRSVSRGRLTNASSPLYMSRRHNSTNQQQALLDPQDRINYIKLLKLRKEVRKYLNRICKSKNINFIKESIEYQGESILQRIPKDFLYQDICDLILEGDSKTLDRISLKNIISHVTVDVGPTEGRDKSNTSSSSIVEYIDEFLLILINEGEYLKATKYMIKFIRKFKDQFKVPIIQYETFQYLLKLIELNSSVDELTPINYGLLQLCINHYQGIKNLEYDEMLLLFRIFTKNVIHGNYFSNYYYDWLLIRNQKLLNFTTNKKYVKQYFQILCQMLQTNLVNLNANRCFKIWEDNQEFIIVNISENENDIDEKLLNEFLDIMTDIFKLWTDENQPIFKPDIAIILEKLTKIDRISDKDKFINFKLEFYGTIFRNNTSFERIITNQLNTPKPSGKDLDGIIINKKFINRSNLSHLFVGFLNLNDETNSNKILETIHKQNNTTNNTNNTSNSFLNQYELNGIIKKLLTNHNDIIKSLQIIENLSWNHCKWSYFEIFKYILIEARSHQKQDVETFLKDFQLRIIENFKDEIFFEELTILILKHIAIMDLRDGIRLYNKILKLSNNTNVIATTTTTTNNNRRSPQSLTNSNTIATKGNLNTNDLSLFEYLNIDEIFDRYTLKSTDKRLRKLLIPNERIKYLPDWLIDKNYLKLINKTSMIKICHHLLIQSVVEKDYYCIIWLFDEMRKFGWSVEDILWVCESYDSEDFLKEIINEKVLSSIK